ncbi:MAG: tRNA (adenosine(37)-N6)-threonylcarbamoyltransferase complex ATPase subunit type 1 TsaE [Pseudomonadota bacterium]
MTDLFRLYSAPQEVPQSVLEEAAAGLAGALSEHEVICLFGDLGAGKSTFARAFLRGCGALGDIPSPTFTIVQIYDEIGPQGSDVWHVDAYRLPGPEEAEPLGLLEALEDATCLIEWPSKIHALLPTHRIDVHLTEASSPSLRTLHIKEVSP